MLKQKKNNRIIIVFFLSFLIVIAVPACALLAVHSMSLNVIKEEVVRNNEALLYQSQHDAENMINIVENSLTSLAFNENVLSFSSEPNTYAASKYLVKVKNVSTDIVGYNYLFGFSGVLEIIVYSKISDAVVSYRTGYSRASNYFDNSLIHENDLDFEKFLDDTKAQSLMLPATDVRLFDNKKSVLTLIKPVMKNYFASDNGHIIALIDASGLMSILGRMNLGETGFALIADNDGEILVMSGKNTEKYKNISDIGVDADEFIKLSSTAPGGRVYMAYIPRQIALSRVASIQKMVIATIAAELLLSLLLALALSYRNAKPILEIFSIVQHEALSPPAQPESLERPQVRGYDYLKGTLKNIIKENGTLRRKVEEQLPVMYSELIRKIISGAIFDIREVEQTAEYIGISLSGSCYALLCVNNTTYGEMVSHEALVSIENALALVKAEFEKLPGMQAHAYNKDRSNTLFLIVFPNGGTEHNHELLSGHIADVDKRLSDMYKLKLNYTVAGFCEDIFDIPELYDAYNNQKQGFDDDKAELTEIYYPLYDETRLIKSVSQSHMDAAEVIIRKIYEKNSDSDHLTAQWFFLTATRIAATMKNQNEILEAASFLLKGEEKPGEWWIDNTVALFNDICASKSNEANETQSKIMDDILEFMRENIHSSTFMIYDVSLRFNYTEAYLHKLFKEKHGMSFALTLEKMRMQYACMLLSDTELTIDEVAARSGYNSAHTFRRVFKKNMGMLPTEYRE